MNNLTFIYAYMYAIINESTHLVYFTNTFLLVISRTLSLAIVNTLL